MKSLLSGGRKDTSVDHQDTDQHDIDRIAIKIGMSAAGFAKQFEAVSRMVFRAKNNLDYDEKHIGMNSYQKWHKPNKKWR